jgi:methionine biosynthesis protein MetW
VGALSVKIVHEVIMKWVEDGASMLDLGCGDGELMSCLIEEKHVRAQGIEISDEAIHRCVARGLSVLQEDIDAGLSAYGDKTFDYVVLNQTFQQVKRPGFVLREALRVGDKVIVGFPNFLYYKARLQMFFGGRVPVIPSLPFEWHDTPNLHFLSIADFGDYCKKQNIRIEGSAFAARNKNVWLLPNLFAEIGLFLLSRRTEMRKSES